MSAAADLATLFDARIAPVRERPFPHAVIDDFLQPDVFAELDATFPETERRGPMKTSAHGLLWGDPEYDRHLDAHPVWRTLFEAIHSQAFVDHIRRQFSDVFEGPSFLPDPDKLRFISYCETREEKEAGGVQRPEHTIQDIYARLDIFQGRQGYARSAHRDHRRRLLSMLVYFDNPEDIGMVGGRLTLHNPVPDLDLAGKLGCELCPPAWLALRGAWSKPVAVEPKANRTAMFAATPRSWHSVPAITSIRSPRRFLHIVLSAGVEIWR